MKRTVLMFVVLALFVEPVIASRPPFLILPQTNEPIPPKKTGFFQKIRRAVLSRLIVKLQNKKLTKQNQKKLARLSLILGLASIAFLLIPFGLWLALPAAILGLIFGIKSVDGNSNAEGIVGIIASGITLSIFLIVGLVLLTVGLATIN